jgi:hypothetical protein
MKKKIELNKKTIKRLKLKLGQKNDRKVAPMVDVLAIAEIQTKGNCVTHQWGGCI